MPRAVVTGGAGFLGSHLTDRLIQEGWSVVVFDNLLTGNADNIAHHFGNPDFRFIRYDVTGYLYVEGPVDFIFHLASPASPVDFARYPIQILKVGALGTHNALGLAKAKGAKFLLASTSEVYGDPLVHPQPEEYWGNVNPIGIRSVYDEAKRFAEAMVMAYHRYHGLDTRIARIFNSILADETIIFFNDDHLRLMPAEAYADQLEQETLWSPTTVQVPSFDPQTGRIHLRRASAFIKHPSLAKDAYRVTTRYGRQIHVTGDHSLFKRDAQGRPVATPVRELRPGDYVAIPARLPVIEHDVVEFNIAQALLKQAEDETTLWEYALVSPSLSQVIEKHRELIYDILMSSRRFEGSRSKRNTVGCSYRKYRDRRLLPLYVVAQLQQRLPFEWPADAWLYPYGRGGGTGIPNRLFVTEDLLWLLGFFMAEGGTYNSGQGTYRIHLCSDIQFLKRAQVVLGQVFGVKVGYVPPTSQRAPALYVYSKLLGHLFNHVFGVGGRSNELRIPTWVLQLPLSRLKHFLEGYRQGDGSHTNDLSRRELAFNTVSRGLANDLVYLLLRFGIIASLGQYETTFKQVYGDARRFPFWRVTVCEVENFDILTWDQEVPQKLNATRWGDLVWVLIRSIEPVPITEYVYDFSVPGCENFVAGNGVFAHNTYGERMRMDDGRVVPNFIVQALRNEPITVYGDGSQTRSFCYVADLIEGIWRLANSDYHLPINLGNPDEYPILQFAEIIQRLTGTQSQIVFTGPITPDDPRQRRPDISKARQILGWEPKISLEEGLQRTIADFQQRLNV